MVGSAAVIFEKGQHKGWTSWHLRKGPLELILVPQVGGRIMGMSWRDHDLFFTQSEREGRVEDLSRLCDLRAKKRAMGFPLWGGDKTWIGPQSRWTDGVPFLDLDSGQYQLDIEHSSPDALAVRMTSPMCRESGVILSRLVRMEAATEGWSVTHRLLNGSPDPIEWAIWDVSMVLRPGRVYLPLNPSSQYEGGVKAFGEEGDSLKVKDVVVSRQGNLAVVSCEDAGRFKYGVDAAEGWLLGIIEADGRLIGYQKQVPVFPVGTYGHGCVAEVYNSDRYPYLEMELHGPVICLQPGEWFELEEKQRLFEVARWPANEDDVRNYLLPAVRKGTDAPA